VTRALTRPPVSGLRVRIGRVAVSHGREHPHDLFRLQAFAVIGVDEGADDRAIGVDHVGRRERQLEAVVAVHRRKVQPEPPVCLAQGFSQLERDSEVARDAVPRVAQHLESQGVLLHRRQRTARELGRDGDQIGSE
jgi:hypothetical protein